MKQSRFSSNPLVNPNEDEFNRRSFSSSLARRIVSISRDNGASVVGLYGKWGGGKSTVLNFVKSDLKGSYNELVDVVDFNPWLYSGLEELNEEFFAMIASTLEVKKSSAKRVSKLLKEYHGVLGMIPFVGTGAMKLGSQIGDAGAVTQEQENEELQKRLFGARKTIVVIMDDLDRLEGVELLHVLKMVRLNANLPHVVYLLALDEGIVAKSVASEYGFDVSTGREFLEKIIEFQVSIPAVGQSRMIDYVVRRAKEVVDDGSIGLSEAGLSEFRKVISDYFSGHLTTPRQAIRFAAALEFSLPMLVGEVDCVQLMVLEGIRIIYPELYFQIRENAWVIEGGREVEFKSIFSQSSGGAIGSVHKNLVDYLFSVARDCCISDPLFTNRYFEYSLRVGDFSYVEYLKFISALEGGNVSAAVVGFSRLAAGGEIRLLRFIKDRMPRLNSVQVNTLACVLAESGAIFSIDFNNGNRRSYELLVECLVIAIDMVFARGVNERNLCVEFIKGLLSVAQPTYLKAELFGEVLKRPSVIFDDEKNEFERIGVEEGLRKIIVDCADVLEDQIFLRGTEAEEFYYIWRKFDRARALQWLNEKITIHPNFAISLVSSFEDGIEAKKRIPSLCDEAIVVAAIRKIADCMSGSLVIKGRVVLDFLKFYDIDNEKSF